MLVSHLVLAVMLKILGKQEPHNYNSQNTLIFARTTALNASLISHIAISSFFNPVNFNNLGIASAGATGKSIGATAASQKPVKKIKQILSENLVKAGEYSKKKIAGKMDHNLTNNSRQRFYSHFFGYFTGHQYHSSCSIVQCAGICCSDCAWNKYCEESTIIEALNIN
jgi:isocitrate lyase